MPLFALIQFDFEGNSFLFQNDTYEIPNISVQQERKITPAMGIPEEDEENTISPMKKPRVSTMFKSPFSKDRSPQKTPISSRTYDTPLFKSPLN